jgi:hypothetical protein
VPCPLSQYVYIIFSSTSAAKAVEIGSAFGMAEAMPFQNSATADSSVARNTRSVGMTTRKTSCTHSCSRNFHTGSTSHSVS